jgi:uncharacterized protein (TIGR00369 family)
VALDDTWTLDRIRGHLGATLPVAALFGVELLSADPAHAAVRVLGSPHSTRHGGTVAGPVLFAAADVATYAWLLAARGAPEAITVDTDIHFLRPATGFPLLARATPLRSGRRLATVEVRIVAERSPDRLLVQATSTFAFPPPGDGGG